MTSLHKPILIVIAGPNGSGKTTITSRLLKSEWLEDAVYINPDNVAQEKFGEWNSIRITFPHGPEIFDRNKTNFYDTFQGIGNETLLNRRR